MAGAFPTARHTHSGLTAHLNLQREFCHSLAFLCPSQPLSSPGQGLGHLWPHEPPDPASTNRVGKTTSSSFCPEAGEVWERGAAFLQGESPPYSSGDEAAPQKPGSLCLSSWSTPGGAEALWRRLQDPGYASPRCPGEPDIPARAAAPCPSPQPPPRLQSTAATLMECHGGFKVIGTWSF